MSPTTTKARPKTKTKADPLAVAAAAAQDLAKASDAANEAGSKAHQGETRAQALLRERQELVYRDPELLAEDGSGKAVSPKNAVGVIDAELGKIDVDGIQARYARAREVERAKRQQYEATVREHGDAIDEQRKVRAEAIRQEYRAAGRSLLAAADGWVNFEQEGMELAAIRGLDNRNVPIEAASQAQKAAREIADTIVDVR